MCSIKRLFFCKQCHGVHQKTRRADEGSQYKVEAYFHMRLMVWRWGLGGFGLFVRYTYPKHKINNQAITAFTTLPSWTWVLGSLLPLGHWCVLGHIRGRRSPMQRYSPEHMHALSSVLLHRVSSFHRGTRAGFPPAPRQPTRLFQAVCTRRRLCAVVILASWLV